jgi:transcriptional regulator with GAF, ATPase, and Fis domain
MDSLKERIREIEKEEILGALSESGWVMAKAARKLGITERMISYRIRKYGIGRREAGHTEGCAEVQDRTGGRQTS